MAENIGNALDAFRLELQLDIALGVRSIGVTDNEGKHPVVAALDEERLPVLLRRIELVGGYANVFTKGPKGVRHIAIMDVKGALDTAGADHMTEDEQPSPDSNVGLFVDYLAERKDGVVLPARLLSRGHSSGALPPRQAELLGR